MAPKITNKVTRVNTKPAAAGGAVKPIDMGKFKTAPKKKLVKTKRTSSPKVTPKKKLKKTSPQPEKVKRVSLLKRLRDVFSRKRKKEQPDTLVAPTKKEMNISSLEEIHASAPAEVITEKEEVIIPISVNQETNVVSKGVEVKEEQIPPPLIEEPPAINTRLIEEDRKVVTSSAVQLSFIEEIMAEESKEDAIPSVSDQELIVEDSQNGQEEATTNEQERELIAQDEDAEVVESPLELQVQVEELESEERNKEPLLSQYDFEDIPFVETGIQKDKNRLSQTFITVLSVVVLLFIVSFFNNVFVAFGYKTKPVSPLSDVLLRGAVKKVPLPGPVLNDSLLALANLPDYSAEMLSDGIINFSNDSSSSLSRFFQALIATQQKKHKTRIAYFGDSMIEGDLVTQDIRSLMQDAFGGNGVGYVPVTSIVAGFRTSIGHSFDGWTTYNLLGEIPDNSHLGISGFSFLPDTVKTIDEEDFSGASWVKFKATNKRHLDKFDELRLLYGKSDGINDVVINGRRYRLKGENVVNQLYIDACKDTTAVDIKFQCTSPVDIYGFSFESGYGVFVDNFSFRGNSGLPITKVTKEIYQCTQQCLNYDLIILGYGLNAMGPSMTDYSWYERGMNNVIKYMKSCFPNTSILLISVGDRSYKKDGIFQTAPSVPEMVGVQKRLAQENGLAFWNLYDAMGGSGSMVKWVEGDTVYANKDYTHFNYKGAHKIGKMLYDELMKEYNSYLKKETH